MIEVIIKGMSKEDCETVKDLLECKTRYALHFEYEKYTMRKYRLIISPLRDCEFRDRFVLQIIKVLIKTIKKLRKKLDEPIEMDDED